MAYIPGWFSGFAQLYQALLNKLNHSMQVHVKLCSFIFSGIQFGNGMVGRMG